MRAQGFPAHSHPFSLSKKRMVLLDHVLDAVLAPGPAAHAALAPAPVTAFCHGAAHGGGGGFLDVDRALDAGPKFFNLWKDQQI